MADHMYKILICIIYLSLRQTMWLFSFIAPFTKGISQTSYLVININYYNLKKWNSGIRAGVKRFNSKNTLYSITVKIGGVASISY